MKCASNTCEKPAKARQKYCSKACSPFANLYLETSRRPKAVKIKRVRPVQTHCKAGHSLEDSYQATSGRQCKVCRKLRDRERYLRRKAREREKT